MHKRAQALLHRVHTCRSGGAMGVGFPRPRPYTTRRRTLAACRRAAAVGARPCSGARSGSRSPPRTAPPLLRASRRSTFRRQASSSAFLTAGRASSLGCMASEWYLLSGCCGQPRNLTLPSPPPCTRASHPTTLLRPSPALRPTPESRCGRWRRCTSLATSSAP